MKARVGRVVWRDDDFRCLAKFGELVSSSGGGQIQDTAYRENGIGSERR